ncbi:MAG: hypothetical protein H6631_00995 [Anaerolineaceae bacterium]|nr:hypothetical protein [Anaerolineaceae bacterium]
MNDQPLQGNLLSSDTITNTWDAANRLLAVSRQPSAVSNIYNGVSDRVGQTVGGNTTDFALDIAGGLPEVIYTSESEVYLHLPGVIVAEKANEVRYHLSDGPSINSGQASARSARRRMTAGRW